MTTIASAIALAISLTQSGEGHHNQMIHPDLSAPHMTISATEKLSWTQCTATAGKTHFTIPGAKTEGECISLALKCIAQDDVQWTYHPYYVTTDSTFTRCNLSLT